ncbi:MAG: FAD-dependent oxidoreductase [Sulfolobales archaeon]
MTETYKFDVVVVGAGPAGCSVAYLLAKAGLRVLLVERGAEAGSKMLWGGKAYAQPIREVWPELDKEAPIHRWISKERFSIVWGERVLTLEYGLGRRVAFTTYLTELVAWMVKKAEEAGALFIDKTRVDEIVVKDNRVIGVRSGSDVVEADIVVDAEGVNRILLEKLGLVPKLSPEQVGVGVKEVLKIDPKILEERMGLSSNEGLSWLVVGDVTKGIPGGGFIYTMRDTLSIGLVLSVSSAIKAVEEDKLNTHVSELLENFRTHPYFYKYWAEAEIIEYGGRLVPEANLKTMPKKLYYPGLLIVGDAGGFLVNAGYTFRGVDTAVYSGKLAAETILEAFNKKSFDDEVLKSYEDKIRRSYIYRELLNHKYISNIMQDPFFFNEIPKLAMESIRKILEAEYEEPKIFNNIRETMKENRIGLLKLLLKLTKVVRNV